MDYVEPVPAIVPGVQGRVLEVLARTEAELSMRSVAKLAQVSVNRAVVVVNRLIDLGIVQRRDAGASALVRLDPENEAARTILALNAIRDSVIRRIAAAAQAIQPPPSSLVIFGSFARGEARPGSDLDVLVVRPPGFGAEAESWQESLGKWSDLSTRITGNPVALLVVDLEEIPTLLRRPHTVWASAEAEGLLLVGRPLAELATPAES